MCCLVYAGLEGTGAENNVSIFIRLRSAYYVHAFVFILFRQNQRKKPIPADIGRCGICLVFRVLPGTWRVNAFSPKFLTHLFGMLPDEREPHNLPWQCLGLGCCYFKTKLCSFQLNRIYTAGLFWWLPSQRQYLYIYIGWIDKYCICQFKKYIYNYHSAVYPPHLFAINVLIHGGEDMLGSSFTRCHNSF